MSFISEAFAQVTTTATTTAAGAPQEPGLLMNLLPFIMIFAVCYVFLIRPQQKLAKAHQELISSIQTGDEVVTSSGIIAKVKKIDKEENIAHVEISDGVVVRINKATISEVLKGDSKNTKAKNKKEAKSAE